MDVPGTFARSPNASFNTSMELSTPIKKIKQLSLNSPVSKLPLYPSINDIFHDNKSDVYQDNVVNSMLQKGYSQKLTNNVLQELNLRAQNISNSKYHQSSSPTKPYSPNPTERRNKRYSQIHNKGFQNMQSIQNHYSVDHGVHRSQVEVNHQLSPDTYTKRRKTLNADDMITFQKIVPTTSPEKSLDSSPVRKISPTKLPDSSPIRRISPSKKSMNLNQLLMEKPANNEFKAPNPPSNKHRYSSLEMAGVKPSTSTSFRNVSSSSSSSYLNTQKKPSTPTLQKKTSIPQLQKKTSIPQLQKKPSIPQLQKKPSIPQLQRKSSIPQLQKKPSLSQLHHENHLSSTQKQSHNTHSAKYSHEREKSQHNMTHLTSSSSFHKQPDSRIPTKPSLSPSKSCYTISNKPSLSPSKSTQSLHSHSKISPSNSSKSLHSSISTKQNYTIPAPFSLYDKPTISSSQKSLNKFQRFKKRFE